MAAVAFLETTNLVGLGLSADKVLRLTKSINIGFDLHATKSKNQSGLRLVSDVVDSSYRVFDGLGKFWQRNAQESSVLDRVRKAKDAAPIPKFLAMKSVEELKIGEVTELLADYKRLAAIIKQAGLA
ncbi:uncharacterized protein B0P05DRAFT_577171 [Gilbertella persicaria]|uniref:uncharacterized protein n=1 Tax=Gilbertella persicaria TaxID=101096 RepID=UPI00221F7471|nr:uncharacterized protein B0P05DRAFT_577171 [Gilbertella persicaria]KAI8092254.1 hypothetical protein B0P05DRAFT_577171 [Gilbertella persicaria]